MDRSSFGAGYCGISNSKVELLNNTLDPNSEFKEQLLEQTYQLGLNYNNTIAGNV